MSRACSGVKDEKGSKSWSSPGVVTVGVSSLRLWRTRSATVRRMPRGSAYYESKGACIYCGATGVRLTDEHIVPYSLGGSHVIREASCLSCADITKRFEQRAARDLWGDARTSFNAPTRRKRERRSHIVIRDQRQPSKNLRIPASEYLEKYPDNLTVRFRHVPDAFGRVLAKIGYGQIMTALDPGDFRPICLPYITGTMSNLSYVVGGSLEDQQPEPENGYSLSTVVFGGPNRMMLIALVRLYANTHAPAYHVVVGDVQGLTRVEVALRKLGVDHAMVTRASALRAHWEPLSLPLPFWSGP